MSQKTIITEFSYTEEELKDFFKFHLTTKDRTKFYYYGLALGSAIIGVVLMFIFKEYLALGFILVVAAIIFLLMYPYQVNRVVKKIVKSRYKYPKQVIVFSDDNITQESKPNHNIYQWGQILEVIETKKYLYLYISINSALIVNKENLKDNLYSELIALIKSKQKLITKYQNR